MSTRTWVAAIWAAIVAAGLLTACQGFHTYDCTMTRPGLYFTQGDTTHTHFALYCRHKPQSISIQVRTYEKNLTTRQWVQVSAIVFTLTNLPPVGHSRGYDITGRCLKHSRAHVHVYGHSVSSTGTYSQKSIYAPSKAGKLTGSCGVRSGSH